MKSRVYRLTPVEVSVRHSLFRSMEWTSGKKKNLSTVAAKGRKGLRKGHAPARATYAWKERGCSYIRVHGHVRLFSKHSR